ncbi:hypothetical protein JCM6882_000822 [Rhodosporidiobolus microsporus]
MSLPSSYSAILSDLNREVLRAQPSDPLQFCANWFAQRLEHERTAARGAAGSPSSNAAPRASSVVSAGGDDSSMRDQTPPQSARSITGETPGINRSASPAPSVGKQQAAASSSSSKPKPTGLPFNQGYSFGGGPRSLTQDDKPSPFSEYPPTGGDASPFARAGNAPDRPSSRGAGGPGQTLSTYGGPRGGSSSKNGSTTPPDGGSPPPPAGGANRLSRGGPPPSTGAVRQPPPPQTNSADDTDEEVDDPRDDPNYHPGRAGGGAGGPFGGTFGAPSGALGGGGPNGPAGGSGAIPASYNLGRRTSVSAESLDPSANTAIPKTVIPKTASQRGRIEKAIANNLLFRNLDEDQHNDVLNAMKEVTVQAGTEVIVQGAVGDFFYVVEEGTFEVWVRGPPTHTYAGPGQSITHPGEEKKVATYGPGGSFGELALMYNAPRAATVVATSRATMWALDRVTFRSILVEHTSRKRKMYEAFLGEVSILQELNAKERAKIADALEEKVYDEGEAVVVEGEVGKNFYIIESGRAEVTKRKRNAQGGLDEEVLGQLGKGDYFGELALINSAPRAATVRAQPGEGRLRVATLGEKAFTRLLGPIIDILARKAERSYGPGAAVNAAPGGAAGSRTSVGGPAGGPALGAGPTDGRRGVSVGSQGDL